MPLLLGKVFVSENMRRPHTYVKATFACTILLSLTLETAAQTRPNLVFCGNYIRAGSDLYSAISRLNEIDGCSPDSDTQALLFIRSNPRGRGEELLSYLNNGGIIITELNGALLYNEIYGTDYTGTFSGQCSDNVFPSILLNPTDPFWQGKPPPVEPPDTSNSCGFDLNALVEGEDEVVALGARTRGDERVISLAYRNQGSGQFIMANSDWRDNDQNSNYTEASKALFGRFISGRITTRSFQTAATLPSGRTGKVKVVTEDETCRFENFPRFIGGEDVTPAPPANLDLFDGLAQFTVSGCTPGATITVTIDYGEPLPEDAKIWKAGDPWRSLATVIEGATATFTITDGGVNDDDGEVNGTIVDPSGVGQLFSDPSGITASAVLEGLGVRYGENPYVP